MEKISYPLPFYLKSKFIQSILASRKPKKFFKTEVVLKQKLILLQLKNKTKFLSHYTKHPNSKGLIILLHGWEGSSHSGYILNSANYFYQKGFSIFRFNFRDHAETHHLNEELFHGNLIEENFLAMKKILENFKERKNYLIGFSIGGNYTIRLALKFSKEKHKSINHFFSISPSINPGKATLKMDKNFLLRNYFLKAWRNSLELKEKFFPYKYNFKKYYNSKTVYELTEQIITEYSNFNSAKEYFDAYGIKSDFTKNLKIPLLILTSEDDPVCPVEDFYNLKENSFLKLIITKYGGHNGFIQNLKYETFYHKIILDELIIQISLF